ncbi:hypothetical protein SAMN04488134_11349 [Amphibacillus marinus]|uniref:Uncharacterized protein n=1 Tax=Amphibacillus marinus TaxID=872970 RepID=A0A1H8SP95_9BACI|nr:hypothetical protein [Amphibacillus marinus]SEO80144.1 hypothetical protein SAMN04488134_11349 [Amphibacillus marinus]
MGLLNKKTDEEYANETTDLLIVFDDEKKTSDIKVVTSLDKESVTVNGNYKVPLQNCEITVGKEGRHFFYRAPSRSIEEVERLAQLEQKIVLTQITSYRPPEPPNTMDMTKLLLFGLLFVAFIAMIFIS